MTAELESVLSDGPIGGESFAARTTCLTRAERACYRRIIASLIEGGSPSLDDLPDVTARLIEADLIQTDDSDCVTVVYPFSAHRTRHRVTLNDGRGYHAMCAIDALGIPYMLDERGEVQAHEPDGQRIVRDRENPPSGDVSQIQHLSVLQTLTRRSPPCAPCGAPTRRAPRTEYRDSQ